MDTQSRNPQHGDGVFSVQISDDGLKALGEFRPSAGKGRPLTIDHVEDVLFQADVSYNIDWFTIHKSIDHCEKDHVVLSDVLVATGVPAKPQIPERLLVESRFRRRHPLPGAVDQQSGNIDLRERHLYVIVQEGDLVARRVPAEEGTEGVSVSGALIPPPVPKVPQPTLGEHVVEEDGKVTALLGGQLIFDSGIIEVHDTLVLSDGVGYHTGHIRFPGNCELSGVVRPGFKIWLGGELHAKEAVDVTEVFSDGNILCDGGFLGHGDGLVRSRGQIRTRFIENCTVECHKAIYVQQSCLYGKLRTLDRVVFGDRSRVVGSEIVASDGVFAHSLGNNRGGRVVVWVGINFVVERKIERLREKVIDLSARILKIRNYLEQHSGERIRMRYQELLDKRSELQRKMGDLLSSLDSNEKAIVAVRDSIFPGSVIHICRSHIVVDETLKKVQFRLDAASGKVVHEPLDPGSMPRLQELESET